MKLKNNLLIFLIIFSFTPHFLYGGDGDEDVIEMSDSVLVEGLFEDGSSDSVSVKIEQGLTHVDFIVTRRFCGKEIISVDKDILRDCWKQFYNVLDLESNESAPDFERLEQLEVPAINVKTLNRLISLFEDMYKLEHEEEKSLARKLRLKKHFKALLYNDSKRLDEEVFQLVKKHERKRLASFITAPAYKQKNITRFYCEITTNAIALFFSCDNDNCTFKSERFSPTLSSNAFQLIFNTGISHSPFITSMY